MYCVSCGKQNPDGAAFCAYCGKPIEAPKPVIEATLMPDEAHVASAPYVADEAHEAFKRPDPARQVKPLPDNPAQPSRRERREASEADNYEPEPTPKREPRPEPKREPRQGAPRAARGAVSAVGPMKQPPGRKPPIQPPEKPGWPLSTLIPKRRHRIEHDLFFEDIDLPSEQPYDEVEDEREWSRKIRSGVAGVFLLGALAFVFWLLVLPGGQVFRASMGMGAPASAFATLGDQYLGENSLRRAADAYYKALSLSPEHYDYALKVAKTQALVGDRNKALSAYAKCISIKAEEWEPYQAVAELYQQMGDNALALNALKIGYDKTGNLDLFRAYEALLAQG